MSHKRLHFFGGDGGGRKTYENFCAAEKKLALHSSVAATAQPDITWQTDAWWHLIIQIVP